MNNRGIKRYAKPAFFPVYGILAGYILMWVVKLTTGIVPYEYFLFTVGSHGFTMADIFLIVGALIGGIYWYVKTKDSKDEQ